MKKLEKTDFSFLQMVYAIWQLFVYYEDFYGYIAPESPLDMNAKLLHRGGTAFIQVTIPRARFVDVAPDISQMKEIMQQYLDYVIMPETDIRPYAGGDSIYDIVEPLRINYIVIHPDNTDAFLVEFFYICDPLSFDYYRMILQNKKI